MKVHLCTYASEAKASSGTRSVPCTFNNSQRKSHDAPQILTHVREKLQFVERENLSGNNGLEVLDQELAEKRDRLGQSKAARDTLRLKGRKIQETSVYITNPNLLDDIEVSNVCLHTKMVDTVVIIYHRTP